MSSHLIPFHPSNPITSHLPPPIPPHLKLEISPPQLPQKPLPTINPLDILKPLKILPPIPRINLLIQRRIIHIDERMIEMQRFGERDAAVDDACCGCVDGGVVGRGGPAVVEV